MQPKTIHPQVVIAKTVRTSLKNIVNAIGNWPNQLWDEVQRHNLKLAGAPVYVYRGCDDNPDTEFDLVMCMPVVDTQNYQGEFEKMELAQYTCVEHLYTGSMPELSTRGWGTFMQELTSQGIAWTGESREVYLKWVDFMSPENQVLLQVGVS